MQNSEFLSLVYGDLTGCYGWTTSFRQDPNAVDTGAWQGQPWRGTDAQKRLIDSRVEDNNFFAVGLMRSKELKRSKAHFERLCVLLADDADVTALMAHPTYIIETSPSKYQIGCILDPRDPDTRNAALIDKVLQEMVREGFMKADASGNNIVRYGRLPVGGNTKKRPSGAFVVKVREIDPVRIYTLDDACMVFGINLDRLKATMLEPAPKRELKPRADTAKLVEAIVTPKIEDRSYHDPLLKLTAKMVSEGVKPETTVEVVTGIMQAGRPEAGPELDRWEARVQEIPRMVKGATDKFAPEDKPKPFSKEKLIRTLDEVGEAFEDIDWLVDELIPEQSVGMIFGASGTFKSFIAIDLVCHVAWGEDFIGKEVRKAPILYLASEGGAGIFRRFEAWHVARELERGKNIHLVTTPLILTLKEQLETLVEAIEDMSEKPALVIIDTLSQTFDGDENSSNDIASYIRSINTDIRSRFNCSVIIIHHTGHNAAERPRGSSAMIANLDFLLGVFKPDPESQTARMTVVKQKDGDRLDDVYFEMVRQPLGVNKKGKPVGSLVSSFNDSLRASRAKASKYDGIVMAALEASEVMSEEALREAAIATTGAGRSAVSRGVARSLQVLANGGFIRRAGPETWRKV